MARKILDIWQEYRPELDRVLNVTEWGANTTAASLGLGMALGLVSPALGVPVAGLALASPIKQAIALIAEKKGKKHTLEEIVAIATPLAYLKSFDMWVQRNSILAKKFNQEENREQQVDARIEQLTLNEELAINVLCNFPESELVQTYNEILISLLRDRGFSKIEAKIIVSWVAWDASAYLEAAIKESKQSISSEIISIYLTNNQENSSFQSIKTYLTEQIEGKPKEKVFNEEFSFEQIYVPLKVATVDANGKVNKYPEPLIVEDWARDILLNPEKAKQVIFIQGGPGRGKSVYCRMFADRVRQEIHPLWIPVLIRLRDITSFELSFEKTLQGAVKASFARDDNWLTDSKLRFLFFLDGFDELRMEGRSGGGVERFIKQVCSFQERCNTSEMGHRFIVTGRQLALQGISYLPNNMERVELLPMDDELQYKWFRVWEKVVDKDAVIAQQKIAAFQDFLGSQNLPKEVKDDLAREPLLLYLLAAMHRDGDIKVKDLESTEGIQTKITIYQKALDWVLTEQRKHVQKEIVPLEDEELTQILIEAGLCVVQSGGECASVAMIRERLQKSEPELAKKISDIQTKSNDEVLKNALAAFYLKPATADRGGSVEFFHKSFGEFLCAKRILQTLEDLTLPGLRGRGFNLNDDRLAEEIYDLLGYGGLTPEIVEYLFGLLTSSPDLHPEKLFTRLEDFYERWCDGEFIDAEGTTLPQAKMRRLKQYKPSFSQSEKSLGQRQVDIYTGLNVMILLLELHRYAQKQEDLKEIINFHPCGKLNEEGKLANSDRLLRIIGYGECIEHYGFLNLVERFLFETNLIQADLRGADLRGADLSRANLSRANLSRADLRRADLREANLREANLRRADLREANLREADLSRANLRTASLDGAYLRGVYLRRADLRRADLREANLREVDLREAYLRGADLSDITWDTETNWENAIGLDTASNLPEELKRLIQSDN